MHILSRGVFLKKLIKKFSHLLRAFFGYLPIKKRVLFYSIRATDSLLENAACVYNALDCKKLICAHKLPHSSLVKLKHYYYLQTSKVIVTDDYLRYLRSIKLRDKQKVVQVWHAGGHFKKFGLDADTKLTHDEEISTHSQYDAVIVSSEESRAAFASGMGIDIERILPLGIPRTDNLLLPDFVSAECRDFFRKYPQFEGKKIYIYCPTFREKDGERVHFNSQIDWNALDKELEDDEVFLIHRHPMIDDVFSVGSCSRIFDLSDCLTTMLLCVCDIVITDYSSVVIDASIMDKPSVFYCPDADSYERDFYLSFPSDLPGEMFKDSGSLLTCVRSTVTSPLPEKIKKFRRSQAEACDGKSTQRVVSLIESYLA